MPITLNHSNINVQYSTGSNYIIETVKSDLYLRDSRTGISSNLTAEPTIINPSTFTERVQSFKHSGTAELQTTYTINFPVDTLCDLLIIGGGGSGSGQHGGGGGAGAVIFMKNVTMNGDYTIKVGKGGVCEVSIPLKGSKGNDTEIFKTNNISNKIVAEGGGGGGQLTNANGGSGGSGGGGDAYGQSAAGLGGAANAYTPILDGVTGIKYGNNGGNAFGNPGHGGGGGGAGGAGENALGAFNSGDNEKERAHGGVGIKSATINSVNYDFKTLFGTNVGGIVETDGFLYFGGGGGNGRWSNASSGVGAEGGNGGLGGGGKGGWATSGGSQPLNGAGYPAVNGTGGGGGGGGDSAPPGGNGGSGIVIIRYNKQLFITEGNPITHKTLDIAYTVANPTYTLNFPVPTTTDILERTAGRGILNNSDLILQGTYDINFTASSATIVPKTGQYLPFTATSNLSQNIAFRYHLLNPIKMPEGAQWTYNSNNANVYHLGNVGIGTTNPSYNLHVNGTIFTSTGGYTQTGLTTWTVMSDRRIKENIVKASYDKCLDNVKNIDLYSFNFKDNCVNTNDKNQLGFIAQEVQQVYPKAVEVGKML